MMINYPKTWGVIIYPESRLSLIEYLRDLSDMNVRNCLAPHYIDEVYHFFFDDTDLTDAHSCIGTILFNSDEAEIISQIIVELRSMLRELGDVDTLAYFQHPSWQVVAKLATNGLALFELQGLPSFSENDDQEAN